MNLDDIPLKKHIVAISVAICLLIPSIAHEAIGYDYNDIYQGNWDTGTIKWKPILHTEMTPRVNVVKYFGNGTCVPYARMRTGIMEVQGNAATLLDRLDSSLIHDKPIVGAVAITSDGGGHVIVIEEIWSNTMMVSEQNFKGLYIVSERIINIDDSRIIAYVYRKM